MMEGPQHMGNLNSRGYHGQSLEKHVTTGRTDEENHRVELIWSFGGDESLKMLHSPDWSTCHKVNLR